MTGPCPSHDAPRGAATSFDLHALLLELEGIVGPRAERRGLRLALVRDTSLPGHVHADRIALRRLLLVLLGAALRLARAGAVDLRVTAGLLMLRGELAVAGLDPAALVRPAEGETEALAAELTRQLGGRLERCAGALRLELPLAEVAA